MLSFFLLIALYGLITGLEDNRPACVYWAWAGAGLALMTKGLIGPVFFFGAAIPYLLLTGQWRRWRALKPVTGTLLFLAIAAPWHILCGIINHDQGHPVGNHPTIGNVHGFFYQYFINEHVLRFFNLRYPHDYNKMPGSLYWLAILRGSFPGACFCPRSWRSHGRHAAHGSHTCATTPARRSISIWTTLCAKTWARMLLRLKFRVRTIWLLSLFTAWTLLFFSISTNQE